MRVNKRELLKAAKARLAPLGISIRYNSEYDEYRVWPTRMKGEEAENHTAYESGEDALECAINSGLAMAEWVKGQRA